MNRPARVTIALTAALLCGLASSACSPTKEDQVTAAPQQGSGIKDRSGSTRAQALARPLAENYALAGEHYDALNAVFTPLQKAISSGAWRDSGTESEVAPGQGFTRGPELEGDGKLEDSTGADSYYFSVYRTFTPQEPVKELLERTAEKWRQNGLQVSSDDPLGSVRYTATTTDGYTLHLDEGQPGTIALTAYSPVYWGPQRELLRSIAARRDAEDEKKTPGTQFERDPKTKQAALEPGEYRPFPAWDAVPAA